MNIHKLICKGVALVYMLFMALLTYVFFTQHEWLLMPFSIGCGLIGLLYVLGAWDDRDPDNAEGE